MRRTLTTLGVAAGLVMASVGVVAWTGNDSSPTASPSPVVAVRSGERPAPSSSSSSTTTTTTRPPIPSSDGPLTLLRRVTGDIAPKSLVASGRGRVFAQNMMYRHTVTVYDEAGDLVATIPDSVDLAAFGIPGHPGISRGAPVEAAFNPDATKAYVSNYSMYGAGFGPEGSDECRPGDGTDDSFVYRVDVKTLAIDAVIPVGSVPKYVAVSPDGKYLVVANWCTFDASIVDLATNREVKRIPLGPYPRGVAISPDSATAYVAVMGSTNIARIDLGSFTTSWMYNIGAGPRHLVVSPDGATLYATLNGEGRVASIDPASGTVRSKIQTGQAPRSMDISADGKHLYVVNYESGTMSKVATATMTKVQDVPTEYHPIGIAYDRATGNVWVANYTGSILIFSS